jgi:hypothetical protein
MDKQWWVIDRDTREVFVVQAEHEGQAALLFDHVHPKYHNRIMVAKIEFEDGVSKARAPTELGSKSSLPALKRAVVDALDALSAIDSDQANELLLALVKENKL